MTPIKLTTMHKWANPTPPTMFIEVTSATLRAHPKQALSTARQKGRGVLEPLYTTRSASSSWSRPRNICRACLSRWHLPRRSPPFIRLGSQPSPKCWQQWPTDELTPSRKCLLPPAWWSLKTTTRLAFDLRMLKLKMKSQRGRAGRHGGARVSSVDCARSPYGESTFKRNRPSFAVLMVLGGGGGGRVPIPLDGIRTSTSGIRAHRASDYTMRVRPPHVTQNKHFRHSPVCVGVCVGVRKKMHETHPPRTGCRHALAHLMIVSRSGLLCPTLVLLTCLSCHVAPHLHDPPWGYFSHLWS